MSWVLNKKYTEIVDKNEEINLFKRYKCNVHFIKYYLLTELQNLHCDKHVKDELMILESLKFNIQNH
jgi:hypothetical protein